METRREFLGASALSAAALSSAMAMRPGLAAPAGSARKIRIGVVGGGFGASFQWHNHPNCEVAAVTDLRADRRKRLREKYRCDNFYDSLEVMLQRAKNLDAVAVFTGAPDHARHVEMCMRRGLHVVCAVPACLTLAEAERLKELKEKTGLRYMMAETSYYRQACIYARNLFRSGGFGELFYSEVEYYHDVYREDIINNPKSNYYHPDGTVSWRQGFPPMHYPTHALGYIVGVTGERIVRTSALGWGDPEQMAMFQGNPYQNPFSNMGAWMQTDQGHMVRCNVMWQIAAGGERANWFGEKGTFYMTRKGIHRVIWDGRRSKPREVTLPEYWNTSRLPERMRHTSGHGSSHTFLTAEFVNALVEDREPAIDVYESLAMTVPGIVSQQSALRNGEQMEVPQFDPAT
jgi:predicted dehydrogenase